MLFCILMSWGFICPVVKCVVEICHCSAMQRAGLWVESEVVASRLWSQYIDYADWFYRILITTSWKMLNEEKLLLARSRCAGTWMAPPHQSMAILPLPVKRMGRREIHVYFKSFAISSQCFDPVPQQPPRIVSDGNSSCKASISFAKSSALPSSSSVLCSNSA